MRPLPLLAFLAALLAHPGLASALTCAAFHVKIMSPPPGEKTPPGTRPLVEVSSVGAADPTSTVKLWLAGSAGKKIATSARVYGQAQVRVVQLIPARPLAPGRYEVRWSNGGQSVLAGAFEVAADARPYTPSRPFLFGQLFDGKVKVFGPDRHVRYLKLTSIQKEPPRTVLAIWIDRGPLDYTKPPLLITDQLPPIAIGQSPSLCPFNNYVVPDGKGKLRLGLKVMDVEGKLGAPVELSIDLGR